MKFGDDQAKIEGLGAKKPIMARFSFLGHGWVNMYKFCIVGRELHYLKLRSPQVNLDIKFPLVYTSIHWNKMKNCLNTSDFYQS